MDQDAMQPNTKTCFVIMPFSDRDTPADNRWDDLYETCLHAAVNKAKTGHTCHRALNPHGSFMTEIADQLVSADIVIAVLTDLRPNVIYELGARHALRRKTIMLAEEGTRLPSDLASHILLFYSTRTANSRKTLINQLTEKIKYLATKSPESDNPIQDHLLKLTKHLTANWLQQENPKDLASNLKRNIPDYVLDLFRFLPSTALERALAAIRDEAQFIDEKATQSDPMVFSKELAMEGARLKDQHKYQEAFEVLSLAMRLDPGNASAKGDLSLLHTILRKKPSKSLEESKASLPTTAEGHNAQGKIFLRQRRFAHAAMAFKAAFKINPTSAIYANNAGYALEMSGKISEALEMYDESLKINGEFAHALYNKGKAMLASHRIGESKTYLMAAHQIDPFVAGEIEAQRASARCNEFKSDDA